MLVEPPRSCALLVAPLLLTLGCNREEPRHVELTLTANLPTVTIATAQATPEPPPRAPWPRRDSGEKRGTLVYSKVRFLWIRPVPRASADWIGYLSLGDSVPLRGSRDEAFVRVATEGACEAWYAVEPRA